MHYEYLALVLEYCGRPVLRIVLCAMDTMVAVAPLLSTTARSFGAARSDVLHEALVTVAMLCRLHVGKCGAANDCAVLND